MKERYHNTGRRARTFRRLTLTEQSAQMAENEIRMYMIGEPSSAFFPVGDKELDTVGHVVFESSRPQLALVEPEKIRHGRKGDRAKRRRVVINTALVEPQNFPATKQNVSIFERHFGRIYRFAQTLKNKGRLNPQIAEILDI